MGLFDNLAEIEKLGALENSSEQLKLYIIDWICSNYSQKFNMKNSCERSLRSS